MPGSANSADPAATMTGPIVSGFSRAVTVDEPAGPARQPAHDQSEGQEGGTRERRRIALDPNEVEGQEKQDAA